MSDSGKAVFLSYASQDAEAVKRICEALRAAGVEVWFDQNELVGGDAWDAKIRGQIGSCALFLPVISANTQARLEGYFRIEWKIAARRTHAMAAAKAFLLPVVIDDTGDAAAHVPDEFRDVQWTRIKGGEAPPAFVARVKKLVDGGPATEDRGQRTEVRTENREPKTGNPKQPRWLPRVLGGVVVAAIALVIARPWQRNNPPASSLPPAASPAAPMAPRSEARKLAAKGRALFENPNYTREDLVLAEDYFQQATKLDSTDAEVWAAWSELNSEYVGGGYDRSDARLEAARSQAQRALSLDANSTEAQYAMASYLRRLGGASRPEAERLLRRLAERTPTDKRVLISLGKNLRDQAISGPRGELEARLAESITWLDRAAALPDGRAEAVREKGWTLHNAGRFEEARSLADEALALQPSRSAYRLKLALAISLGLTEEGVAMLKQMPPEYLRHDEGATAAFRLWYRSREPDKALEALRPMTHDYISTNTYTGPTRLLTGLAHELAGRRAAAESEWRAALEVVEKRLQAKPGDWDLLSDKTTLQAMLGRRQAAEQGLKTLLQLSGMDSDNLDAGFPLIRIRLGQLDEAIAWFQSARQGRRWARIAPMLRFDPGYDPIRDDPRIQVLLKEPAVPKTEDKGQTTEVRAPIDQKSVAVLAFANLSDDKANEYFSDGISEELLNVLAKVPGLKVTARTSSFFFKGKEVPVPEIAKQLGVAYVIEGSVRRQGEKVRINAQLIKAADGFNVWSENFTRDLKDIFAVQDEIAGLIAKNLELKLGTSSTAAKVAVNPQAFELYVQARRAWNLRNAAGFSEAEELLTRALTLEPNFARAHAALADVWMLRAIANGVIGSFGQREAPIFAQITSAIQKALVLDPDSSEARASLGLVMRMQQWDLSRSEREFRRAVELNPNYATAHHWLGNNLEESGWIDEGLAESRRAAELDPFSLRILENYAKGLVRAGRCEEALAVLGRAEALQARAPLTLHTKAEALLKLGRRAEAIAVARELDDVERAELLARAGEKTEAEAALTDAEGWARYQLLTALGRTGEALAKLQAEDVPASDVGNWLMDPRLDPFRQDPHFVELLKTLGLTEAHARAQAWRAAHPKS